MESASPLETKFAESKRVEELVRLMEEDRLGYRLERFVAQQRDELSKGLTADAFSLTPPQGLSYKDLAERLKMYDAEVLPYMEFFAVGTPVCHNRGCCWRIIQTAPATADLCAQKWAKREDRVFARGTSSNQAVRRSTLSAVAMTTFCKWVLASPI